jgi:MerR family transcriptional regulator, light-induced transcriptional regulator
MRLSEEAGVRNLFSSEQHGRERQVQALEGHDGKKYVASVAAIAIAKVAKKTQAKNEIAPSEVRALARLAIEADVSIVEAFVGNVMHRGVQVEKVYLQLLEPTLQLLGSMWESDDLNFSLLTIACGRLQKVMFMLEETPAKLSSSGATKTQKVGRIFLSAVPGSQHTLGVQMLADIFRKNDWSVHTSIACRQSDILKALRADDYDVIGFSIGSEVLVPALISLVAAVRLTSKNATTPLMVGGPLWSKGVVQSHDQSVEVKDVDFLSGDALASLAWANAELLKVCRRAAAVM